MLAQIRQCLNGYWQIVIVMLVLQISPINLSASDKKDQLDFPVQGTVTSKDAGDPLPGVNVRVKDTSIGVITDTDGNYKINVPDENSVLVFSFIGFENQEVAINGRNTVDVVLAEDVESLEEIVVVGYGTQRKSDLTGSVVSADIEAFNESPNVSIVQSLQGSVPGVNIGQVNSAGENPSILIRGQNSFNSGNNSPLIVLDGVIYKGSIVDINPSDIESVDVLKDASSAAIYGSRAANGVIIVTTKKGQSGKPVFNYNGSYSIQTPSTEVKLLDRAEYIQKTRDALWEQGYLEPDYTRPNPDFDPTAGWSDPAIIKGYEQGTDFDWWDAATQTGYIQNHNLSMRGRNGGTSYFVSGGYTDQLGYVINDKYKRYSARVNLENEIRDWFQVGVKSNISTSDYSGVSPNMSDVLRMSPLTTPYDENGELVQYPYGMTVPNPFFNSEIDESSKQLNLFAVFYADIDVFFIPGLSYRFNYSHNYRTNRQYQFNPYGQNFLGSASKYNANGYDWIFDNILTYNKSFSNHNLNITLVAGREESQYENSTLSANTFSNMDLGYNKMNVAENQFTSSAAWDESSLYYMGRLNYDFSRKYLATFTVRRDGFSGFSENNKFGVFPSAALAWIISEEGFMKTNPLAIDFLKLRASYGVNGNRTLGRYGTLARVNASPNYIFGDGATPSLGQNISSLANSDLTWETTTGINLGLDFALLKDRISGNIDYYNTNTEDILYTINIPWVTGFDRITSNLGKIHNSGIEFAINSTNINTNDFSWDLGFNFSRNRNEIISIIGLDEDGDGVEDDLVSNSLFIGEPLGAIYTYNIEGIYQLADELPAGYRPGHYRLKDLNGDGLITPEHDREIIGYSDPSYRFGVNNVVRYKNWTLRSFINSIQGGENYYYAANEPSASWEYNDHSTNSTSAKWDYWTPANPDAAYPQLFYPTPIGANAYRQRSFVRLQDVSLSYQFNKSILERVGIQNIKLFLSGKNLYTWTKWEGWDPETAQGLTRSGRPVLKSYTMGIDLSF